MKRLNYSPDWNEAFEFAVDTSLGDDQALAEDLKIYVMCVCARVYGCVCGCMHTNRCKWPACHKHSQTRARAHTHTQGLGPNG